MLLVRLLRRTIDEARYPFVAAARPAQGDLGEIGTTGAKARTPAAAEIRHGAPTKAEKLRKLAFCVLR